VPKKKRLSSRRRRAPSRGLIVAISLLLVGVAFVLARSHGPARSVRQAAVEKPAAEGSDSDETDGGEAAPIVAESDWARVKLRLRSEYLRAFRPKDQAALYRLTSRTLRGTLEQIGVDRYHIDERPGAARASGAAPAPVQWRIEVPRRASLYRINDAVTQAMEMLGGHVLYGSERPARTMGLALHLRLGYGNRVTHAIVVEPADSLYDADARIAFLVVDADPESAPLLRSYLKSRIPFSFALRPDVKNIGSLARTIRAGHHEVLLHLPMEPRGYPRVDPGRDAILLDLSRIEIQDRITRCLNRVGSAQGVVSRYGSAALNDPDVMRAVLGELRRRDLPFFDAHGVGPSMSEEVAEETGTRTVVVGASLEGAWRTQAAVRAKLKSIVSLATQRGTLAVTLRPSALVLTVLEAEEANLRAKGVEFVAASRLML
jgi:polysaccharide deacetylase 2 family uncharacterized protein YibQ